MLSRKASNRTTYKILKGGKEKYICLFVEDSWKDTQVTGNKIFLKERSWGAAEKGRERIALHTLPILLDFEPCEFINFSKNIWIKLK